MNNKILVSVVIPTYNTRDLLEKTLHSLIHQNFDCTQYELIIVNDGSKDDTAKFLENFTKGKNNIKYANQKNKGAASARNKGIKMAKGEIIAFTDSDCIADKNWLKEITKLFFVDKEIVGVVGSTKSNVNKITPFTHQVIDEEGKHFPTCNIAYRKKLLEKINGFNEKFRYVGFEDTDLYIRISELGKVIHNKDAIIYHPPILLSFLQLVKRMKVEFDGQIKFCKEYPHLFKNRNLILTTLWIRGWQEFISGIIKHKHWLLKNPFIYGEYILVLIFQRVYLVYLCISYGTTKRINLYSSNIEKVGNFLQA